MASRERDSLTRGLSPEDVGQLRLMLGKRIYKYNTVNPSDVFGIKLKEGLHFEGSLKFYFNSGNEEIMKVLTMTSTTMVNDLLPLLIERFCFQNYTSPDHIRFNSSENYIIMKTIAEERRLLSDEHPLQLALDVVEHTGENPTFYFHSNISQIRSPSLEDDVTRKTGKFLSSDDAPYFAETTSKYANGSLQTLSESNHVTKGSTDVQASDSKKKSSRMSFLIQSPRSAKRTKSTNPMPSSEASSKSNHVPSSSNNAKPKTSRSRTSVSSIFSPFQRNKKKGSTEALSKTNGGHPDPLHTAQLRSLLSPNTDLRKIPKSVLLPIFGPTNTVASGQVYKTILVSQSASTSEVIGQALERYNIKDQHNQYVLMDTIGHEEPVTGGSGDKNDVVFIRLCTRQLDKEEIPVLLDQLWKPANKLLRRFELVKEAEVASLFDRQLDAVHTPLSPHPMMRSSQGAAHDKFSDSSSTDLEMLVSKSEDEFSTKSFVDDFSSRRRAFTSNESLSGNFSKPMRKEKIRDSVSRESSPYVRRGRSSSLKSGLYQVPLGSPYLLNLTPSKRSSDHILFQLGPGITELGIFPSDSSVASDGDTSVIHLSVLYELFPKAHDLVACKIYTPSSTDEDMDTPIMEVPSSLRYHSYINCSLNGHSVFPGECYELHHSDLVQISHAMYMFVDPTITLPSLATPSWIPKNVKEPVKVELQGSFEKDASPLSTLPRDDSGTLSLTEFPDNLVWNSVEELEAKHMMEDVGETNEEDIFSPQDDETIADQDEPLKTTPSENSLVPIVFSAGHWVLNLSLFDEKSFLNTLTTKISPTSLNNKLAVGYLLAMGLEYHKANSTGETCKEYMGRVLESLQVCVMTCCQQLSEWKPSHDMLSVLPSVYPLLSGVVFWLSNVLAVASYIGEDAGCTFTTPEWQKALTNVIQYAFQNLSYPVTMVLYAMLQSLLAVAMANSTSTAAKCMDQVTDFLQLVLCIFEDHCVSRSYISQFFVSLFGFISGSLVNLFLGEEDCKEVLSYQCGSQLRKHFDHLQRWSVRVGLEKEAAKYLSPLMSILDILSTPEDNLVERDWSHLREEYPSLNAAQLHFVLVHYAFTEGRVRPAGWVPPAEELEDATNNDYVKENFKHLPTIEVSSMEIIDLSREPPDVDELSRLMGSVSSLYPTKKQATETSMMTKETGDSPCPDSGLDSPARVGEATKTDVPEIIVEPYLDSRQVSLESQSEVSHPTESVQPIVVESLDVVEEMPPPVHVMTEITPVKSEDPSIGPLIRDFTLSRGSKDFGITLALSSCSSSSIKPHIVIASVTPISLSEEGDDLLLLSEGDKVLKIDGMDFGGDLKSAQRYLKDAEDEVTITVKQKCSTN